MPPKILPNIIKYTQIKGRHGALLQSVPVDSPSADAAQQQLLIKFRDHAGEIQGKYERSEAHSADEYWIHDAKFNGTLFKYLVRKRLAWKGADPGAHGHRIWYALHPVLGSAIMTTLGLSIAKERKYDIVTPSTEFHEILLTNNKDAIFDMLLTSEEPFTAPTTSQASHDLGQLVITMTGVNYRAIRPEAIPELQISENFGKFQNLIKTKATSFELNGDPRDYETQLKIQADEIITAWQETKHEVSNELKNALFDTASTLAEPVLKSMIKAPDVTDLAIAGGVAIALIIRRGLHMKKRRGPPDICLKSFDPRLISYK